MIIVDVCRCLSIFFLDDLSCRFLVTSIICPFDVLSVDVLSISLFPRVSPLTHARCNPVAFGFKPRRIGVKLGTRAKFRILIVKNAKFDGPPFEPSTSAKLAGSVSVLVSVPPLTPSRCNPVALGHKPRESV